MIFSGHGSGLESAGLVVAVVSGGLDSVTMAHDLASQGYTLHLLAFDYGQRHRKELQFALQCAHDLNAGFDCVDLTSVTRLLGGCALTDLSLPVPHGHYADDNMKITVVPNRNAIFLTVAYGAAVAKHAVAVAAGMHAGDHAVYPDCRPEFASAFESMQRVAVEGFGHPQLQLLTPYLHFDKAGIVARGAALHVPFDRTWSCYEGGELHCGRCGTCVERREAFTLAAVPDPTPYAPS